MGMQDAMGTEARAHTLHKNAARTPKSLKPLSASSAGINATGPDENNARQRMHPLRANRAPPASAAPITTTAITAAIRVPVLASPADCRAACTADLLLSLRLTILPSSPAFTVNEEGSCTASPAGNTPTLSGSDNN